MRHGSALGIGLLLGLAACSGGGSNSPGGTLDGGQDADVGDGSIGDGDQMGDGDGDGDEVDAGDGDGDGDGDEVDAGDGDGDAGPEPVCTAGAKRCDGLTPQTCSGDGSAWESADAACEFLCDSGACVGECSPGAVRCDGAFGLATCSEAGSWSTTPCAIDRECVSDACVCLAGDVEDAGSCVPDYCAEAHGSCAPNATCSTDGAVSCTCPAGQIGNGLACSAREPQLNEGFENVSGLAGTGWLAYALSEPLDMEFATFISQGFVDPDTFAAQAGPDDSYATFDYLNASEAGTASSWLVTPVVNFGEQPEFSFYTRTIKDTAAPDRLEVRLCLADCDVAPVGAEGTGPFSLLLHTVNPDLTLDGYPEEWQQFTFDHNHGLPVSGTGRFAFRYFVPNAGPLGINGNYIGVDSVQFRAGTPLHTLRATVSGVSGAGLVLELNGLDQRVVNADGTLDFTEVGLGTPYALRVVAAPEGQACRVINGRGTVAGDVADIQVQCAAQ